MSEIKRFETHLDYINHDPNGSFVLYTDHISALEAVKATTAEPVSNVMGSQEAIAKLLFERFAPDHHIDWPPTHATEYRLAAEDILNLLDREASRQTASDLLRSNWSSFCDADAFPGSDTFADAMEAAGFIELVAVTKADLAESFAAERGIEPNGMMYRLTDAGRSALVPSPALEANQKNLPHEPKKDAVDHMIDFILSDDTPVGPEDEDDIHMVENAIADGEARLAARRVSRQAAERLFSKLGSPFGFDRNMRDEDERLIAEALEANQQELDRQHTLRDNLKRKYEGVCAKLELAEAALRDLEAKEPHSLSDLIDRLRGIYRVSITDGYGPAGGDEPDNAKEFVSTFETTPIQHEAASALEANQQEIETLREQLHTATDVAFEAMEQVETMRADNKRLTRIATDRRYMMDAYRAMLGPVALKVAKAWETKGVLRQHTYWGPEAHKLTGEERAQHLLDAESGVLSLDFNNSHITPSQPEPTGGQSDD